MCSTAKRRGRLMNADIPYLSCFVRREFISKNSGHEEAYAFAIQSITGRALGFHVMLKSGAHYRGVPIHALTLTGHAGRPLGDVQLWDCFSDRPVVTVFSYLRDHQADCYLRSGKAPGSYLFTVDWLPNSPERPGFTLTPEQNKCAHVMALEDGNLAALPTNRIAWKDGYFCGATPDPGACGYRVQKDIYQAESCEWDVSQDERYYYRPAGDPGRASTISGVAVPPGGIRPSGATPDGLATI